MRYRRFGRSDLALCILWIFNVRHGTRTARSRRKCKASASFYSAAYGANIAFDCLHRLKAASSSRVLRSAPLSFSCTKLTRTRRLAE